MTAEMILALINLGTQMIAGATALIAKGQVVMSATDATQIKAALAQAQSASAAARPSVDAVLDAAAKR